MASKAGTAARRPSAPSATPEPEEPSPPVATPTDLAAALANLATALATRTETPQRSQATTNLELAVMCQHLEHTAMALTHYFVNQARHADGLTWETIGHAFGTTRQSAHLRFGKGSPVDGRYAGQKPSLREG